MAPLYANSTVVLRAACHDMVAFQLFTYGVW